MLFLTGFPGFLGTRLVETMAAHDPSLQFALLVQPKFEAKAHTVLQRIDLTDRATVYPGDITKPDLGLGDDYGSIARSITHAVHLAAVYDLTIPRDIGWRVNVTGTQHVLDCMASAPQLQTFGYVSTAYVSGKRKGRVLEDELTHNTGFKNFYEETKYHAEVLVREHMDTVPTMVFRPGIVVGDSQTGETDKFDGPYFILRALQRLPRYTVMARVGDGTAPVHLTPVDYVINAMAHLMRTPAHNGTTFHLTDPNALSTQQIMETFVDQLDMHVAYLPVGPSFARGVMGTAAGRYLGIAPELIDYFDHEVHYDTRRVEEALAGTGITCPSLTEYAPRMVAFMNAHHDQARSEAMY
ncbi:MAG: SDR family oxidoreductase [Longimonas sp.]|uniref:SDR family oxidoreductase n=1 Tax=Longimonas sp. TaxID=2039626 RepID=UPI0033640FF2